MIPPATPPEPLDMPSTGWEGATAEEWRSLWRVPGLRLYLRVGSTNDVARRLAREGVADGTVVLAESQTRGRGREGRSWYSPPGAALLMSIIRRVPAGARAPGTAPLRVGLAVAAAIERTAGIGAMLKWPNDVLEPAGRKLAGVLCEASMSEAGGIVIVGVGVNVAHASEDFPDELRSLAASIRIAAGRAVARPDLVGALLRELERLAGGDRLVRAFDDQELRELRGRNALLGREVEIDGTRQASAVGIAADGALLVRTRDGREGRILSGTVRLLPMSTGARRTS